MKILKFNFQNLLKLEYYLLLGSTAVKSAFKKIKRTIEENTQLQQKFQSLT